MTMFNNGRGCITLPELISALEIEGLPRKKSAEDEATNESGSEEKKRPIVKRAKVVEIKTFPENHQFIIPEGEMPDEFFVVKKSPGNTAALIKDVHDKKRRACN